MSDKEESKQMSEEVATQTSSSSSSDSSSSTTTTEKASSKSVDDFYLRYYVGHKGKFGHEFLEFEFKPDGHMRYANNSEYKKDHMIRKEGSSLKLVPLLLLLSLLILFVWPCFLQFGLVTRS
jgi:hypothetical protein